MIVPRAKPFLNSGPAVMRGKAAQIRRRMAQPLIALAQGSKTDRDIEAVEGKDHQPCEGKFVPLPCKEHHGPDQCRVKIDHPIPVTVRLCAQSHHYAQYLGQFDAGRRGRRAALDFGHLAWLDRHGDLDPKLKYPVQIALLPMQNQSCARTEADAPRP